jgi:cell wall assembly regulator SMI1
MSQTDDITSPWIRIVRWLESDAPASARALQPPAGDADIARLNDSLGFRVPEVLEAWLRLNNGSTAKDTPEVIGGVPTVIPHPDSRILPGGKVFLDCQRIAQQHAHYLWIASEIEDEGWWQPGWIPVAEETEGHEGFLIDTSQVGLPVLRFTETSHPKPYTGSLGEWLHAVADAIEYGIDAPGVLLRGQWASSEGEHIAWHN